LAEFDWVIDEFLPVENPGSAWLENYPPGKSVDRAPIRKHSPIPPPGCKPHPPCGEVSVQALFPSTVKMLLAMRRSLRVIQSACFVFIASFISKYRAIPDSFGQS